MTDNFDEIRGMLTFPDENAFYFLKILKRRKDNPGLERDVINIKDYFIYSFKEFDNLRSEIRNKCDMENARAYFRINRRDAKKVAMKTLKRTMVVLFEE